MNRMLPLFCGALLAVALLAGCDAATSDTDETALATPVDVQAALGAAFADFERAYAALDPVAQDDDDAVAALMDEALARHFGDAAKATGDPTPVPRRFGPFTISFGQEQTRFGTLNSTTDFDVYLYRVTGTATGELEGRMEAQGATVMASLRVNGVLRDSDTNEDNVTAEAIVTAPVRAAVAVSFVTPPPGGFPATYEHRIQFQNPD